MTISVILPSRGRPWRFKAACDLLLDKAKRPLNLEIICRVDLDDECLTSYANVAHALHPWRVVLVAGPRYAGYASNHLMIDEAFRLSTGGIVMQYNDDAEMETRDWDEKFEECVTGLHELVVISSDVKPAVHTRFSFPAISRELLNLTGHFSIGLDPSVDRCWQALAAELKCEAKSGVTIYHHNMRNSKEADQTYLDAKGFFAEFSKDPAGRLAKHQEIGKHYAELVRNQL